MQGMVFAIMKNIFLNLKRAKSSGEIPSDWVEDVESGDQRFSGSVWPQPFEIFLRDIMREDIERAMDSLSDDFRSVVLLCDVEGFSYAEQPSFWNTRGTVGQASQGQASLQSMLSQWYTEGMGFGWVLNACSFLITMMITYQKSWIPRGLPEWKSREGLP